MIFSYTTNGIVNSEIEYDNVSELVLVNLIFHKVRRNYLKKLNTAKKLTKQSGKKKSGLATSKLCNTHV